MLISLIIFTNSICICFKYRSILFYPVNRSNSAERRKSDDASPKKEGSRSRSNSDASKRKGSAFMASMKAAMLVSYKTTLNGVGMRFLKMTFN